MCHEADRKIFPKITSREWWVSVMGFAQGIPKSSSLSLKAYRSWEDIFPPNIFPLFVFSRIIRETLSFPSQTVALNPLTFSFPPPIDSALLHPLWHLCGLASSSGLGFISHASTAWRWWPSWCTQSVSIDTVETSRCQRTYSAVAVSMDWQVQRKKIQKQKDIQRKLQKSEIFLKLIGSFSECASLWGCFVADVPRIRSVAHLCWYPSWSWPSPCVDTYSLRHHVLLLLPPALSLPSLNLSYRVGWHHFLWSVAFHDSALIGFIHIVISDNPKNALQTHG